MAQRNKIGKIVNKDECVNWTGAKNQSGYPIKWLNGKAQMYLRYKWMLEHGDIPPGRCICHHCDNPSCINPDHIFLGSYADNMRDMIAKGRARYAYGIHHGRSKMNPEKVLEIRKKHEAGMMIKDLCTEYGMSRTGIHKIVYRITWKHVID